MTERSRDSSTAFARDGARITLLLLVTAVARALFVYRGGMGDADSIVMAAGMTLGLSADTSFGDTLLYGRQVNPGFFFLFRAIYPLFFHDPAHVVAFLNGLAVVMATLLVWPLYVIFRRTMDADRAVASVLILVFSPIVWELGTYFHPIIAATLAMLAAVFAWQRIAWSRSGTLFFLVTCVLGFVAAALRVEVFLAVPAMIVWAALSRRRGRNLVCLGALVSLVTFSYVALIRSISAATTVEHLRPGQFAAWFAGNYAQGVRPATIVKQLVWAAFGIGVATCLLVAAGLVVNRRRARAGDEAERSSLVAAIVWVAVTLGAWLPISFPALRHFFLAALGCAWLSALAWMRWPARRLAVGVVCVIAVNLFVPEIFYRAYNAAHAASPKEPHGTFFYEHGRGVARIARYDALCAKAVPAAGTTGAAGAEAGDANLRPGSAVVAGWEVFGHVVYRLAATGRVRPLSQTSPSPGIYLHRYAAGDVEVRVIHVGSFVSVRSNEPLAALLATARTEGFTVFVPSESAADFAGSRPGLSFTPY